MNLSTTPATTFTAWVDALDALERELEWADELSRETTGSWTAPAGLGALPPELVERARSILAAQHLAMDRVERKRRETSRHLAAVRSFDPQGSSGRSVYLDVAG